MPHILLAENGSTALDLAGGLLEIPDLTFDVITDGRSLLDRINADSNCCDAIILAYDLTEISGLECASFLRQMYQRLPILVLVENLTDNDRRQLSNAGIRAKYIQTKPIDRPEFKQWVQQALKDAPVRHTPNK